MRPPAPSTNTTSVLVILALGAGGLVLLTAGSRIAPVRRRSEG
jgi:hypothetical protein